MGSTAVLGNNLIIYQGVQIISNFAKWVFDETNNPKHHAAIGDYTILCANSTIIGNISIGRNCIIGAGAIVTKPVPDNSIVIGTNQIKPNQFENCKIIDKISVKEKTLFYSK